MPHQQTPPAAADVAADVAYEAGELHRAGRTRAQAVHTLHTMANASEATGDESRGRTAPGSSNTCREPRDVQLLDTCRTERRH